MQLTAAEQQARKVMNMAKRDCSLVGMVGLRNSMTAMEKRTKSGSREVL